MPTVLGKTACRLAARRLLNKALQIRKEHAGILLKSIRSSKSLQIIRGITLWRQRFFSMTLLTSSDSAACRFFWNKHITMMHSYYDAGAHIVHRPLHDEDTVSSCAALQIVL